MTPPRTSPYCKQGHWLVGANLYMDTRGRAQCITCRKEASRKWWAKKHLTTKSERTHCRSGKHRWLPILIGKKRPRWTCEECHLDAQARYREKVKAQRERAHASS